MVTSKGDHRERDEKKASGGTLGSVGIVEGHSEEVGTENE